MIVRRAVFSDLGKLMGLLPRLQANVLNDPAKVTEDELELFIAADRLWVAVVDGAIAGFSAADAARQTIWALFVDPAHEGQGLGRRLLTLAVGTLRNAGCPGVTLKAAPDTPAEALYRAAGYEEVSRSGEAVVFAFSFEAPPPVSAVRAI